MLALIAQTLIIYFPIKGPIRRNTTLLQRVDQGDLDPALVSDIMITSSLILLNSYQATGYHLRHDAVNVYVKKRSWSCVCVS